MYKKERVVSLLADPFQRIVHRVKIRLFAAFTIRSVYLRAFIEIEIR